jgi:outer membrane protein
MAYFEMDSVDQNYNYAKFIRENLKKKEDQLNMQLMELKKGYMKQWDEWKKKKGPILSQADNDAMNNQYQGMLQEYNNKQKELTDELESEKYKMYADANKKITEYLKEFNKDKGFNYIIADQANVFYYKDSLYNITQELVKGLNSQYELEKKK